MSFLQHILEEMGPQTELPREGGGADLDQLAEHVAIEMIESAIPFRCPESWFKLLGMHKN